MDFVAIKNALENVKEQILQMEENRQESFPQYHQLHVRFNNLCAMLVEYHG